MKKPFIIGLFVFFLLITITSVSATPTDGVAYYNFNDNTNDQWGSYDGTPSSLSYDTTYPIYNFSGDGATKAGNFDGSTTYVDISQQGLEGDFTNGLTVSLWFKSDSLSTGTSQVLVDFSDSVGTAGSRGGGVRLYDEEDTNYINFKIGDVGGGSNYENVEYNWVGYDNNYHHLVGTWDNSIGRIYLDGVQVATDNTNSGSINDFNLQGLGYRRYRDTGVSDPMHFFDGHMDEVKIYSKSLNSTEVQNLYNCGNESGCSAPPPTEYFDITAIDNETSAGINTFNVTIDLDNGTTDLFFSTDNGTINTGINQSLNISANITFQSNNYFDRTYTDYNTSTDLEGVLQYTDPVPPQLTTNFQNETVTYGENIVSQFNFSDNILLHSVNITIDYNISVFLKEGDIESDSYIYNLSYNPENLSFGNHVLRARVGDGHTASKLKAPESYKISDGVFNDILRYDFDAPYKETYIKIEGLPGDLFDDFTSEYDDIKQDRYTFKYKPENKASSYSFKVTSDDYIHIVEKKGHYGGQWIIVDEHWMDFYTPEYPDAQVSIERISDTEVDVTVVGVPDSEEEIEFSSVGDINTVQYNYSFFKGNYTTTTPGDVLETQKLKFEINFTKNSYVSDIDATLNYNGSTYTPTKSTTTNNIYLYKFISPSLLSIDVNSTNRTSYWNFTIIGNVNNESNITANGLTETFKMIMSNCTGIATTLSLNFSIFDEDTGNSINADTAASFTIWNRTGTESRNYGLSMDNLSNHEYCIYPSWAYFNTDYTIDYDADTYNARSYSTSDDYMNNVTQKFNLFLTPGSSTTEITVTIVDEFDDGLANYNVLVYRYDITTNNYTLIDTQETDNQGKVEFNLDVSNKQYQFIVKEGDDIVYTEPKQPLLDTSYTLRVRLGETPKSEIIRLEALTRDIWESNHTFYISWNDIGNLITNVNFTTYKENTTHSVLLNTQESNSNATTLNYNFGNSTGHYVARFYVQSSRNNQWYLLETYTKDVKDAYFVFGDEAMMPVIFFVLTLFVAGLVFGPEIPLVLSGLGLIFFWIMGFLVMSWISLITFLGALIFVMVRLRR